MLGKYHLVPGEVFFFILMGIVDSAQSVMDPYHRKVFECSVTPIYPLNNVDNSFLLQWEIVE